MFKKTRKYSSNHHILFQITCILCVTTYISSLILNLSLIISQIYYEMMRKMFCILLNRKYQLLNSQTHQFWKQSITSLNKFISTKKLNLFAANLQSIFILNILYSIFVILYSIFSPWTREDDRYHSGGQAESLFFRKLIFM